jgi:hypothetical protein
MKRLFIVHGWGGRPDKGWLGWLNAESTKRGFKVVAELMPEPEFPKIGPWVSKLKELVGTPDGDTYFVGHSIGVQTIIRYLESLPENSRVGGAIFVAGWFNLKKLDTDEEKEVAGPWLSTPIDLKKVRTIISRSVALFSDDDPYVPVEDSRLFRDGLDSKIIIERNKGHFVEGEIGKMPVVLDELMRISAL